MGRVIQAANPQLSVPNATVKITTTVIGRAALGGRAVSTYIVYTNDQGVFAVTGIGTDKIASAAVVSVAPQDTSLQSQKITFSLANGRPTDLIIALPPTSFDLANVAKVVLTQLSGTGGPNPSAQFKAQVFDARFNDLGILPTLIFDGGVASIAADGTFIVTPASGLTAPAGTHPLGTVTGTVDTHQSSAPPTTTTTPTLSSPTVSGGGATTPQSGIPTPPAPPTG